MSSRADRQRDPDGALSVETSGPNRHAKTAAVIPTDEAVQIAGQHTSLRASDHSIESTPGLTRATRDRDRAYPRDQAGTPNPRKSPRPLTDPTTLNRPTSYQTRMRYRVARQAKKAMTATEQQAVGSITSTTAERWTDLNEALSAAGRDGVPLTADQQQTAQRIDRAIAKYETRSDRTHRVFAALDLDGLRADTDWLVEATQNASFTFDQYTAASHDPAELPTPAVVMEIITNRGLYLGKPTGPRAGHLLPRGIQAHVTAVTTVTIQRGDQTVTVPCIHLHTDNTPTKGSS